MLSTQVILTHHISFSQAEDHKNTFIKKEILKRTGLIEVKSIPGNFDYKNLESSAFAWLAMKRDQGKLILKLI
jgi:hypothetical protein